MSSTRPRLALAAALASSLSLLSMGGTSLAQEGSPLASSVEPVSGSITIYTSVTQDTVDAVLAALEQVHPDLDVEVFRAPTGELDARIASEQRIGGIGADVLWLTDPLSIQRHEADGLLAPLAGEAFEAVPPQYRGETFVGTRLLNLVIVAGDEMDPPPASWSDLADPAYAGRVAFPDPGFAGSGFAALGSLATTEGYGIEFYEQLHDNGAAPVQSPVDVMTGVAEGIYDAGISLDKIVRDAVAGGSPIQLVWPADGAIAVFSPVSVVAASDDAAAAEAFAAFLVSPEAQAAIAGTGWQPVLQSVAWPEQGPVVAPDWSILYGNQAQLLEEYDAIFGE